MTYIEQDSCKNSFPSASWSYLIQKSKIVAEILRCSARSMSIYAEKVLLYDVTFLKSDTLFQIWFNLIWLDDEFNKQFNFLIKESMSFSERNLLIITDVACSVKAIRSDEAFPIELRKSASTWIASMFRTIIHMRITLE